MSRNIFQPPWRDKLTTGHLGPEFGPRTASTFARKNVEHRDWSFRPRDQKAGPDDVVHDFMAVCGEVPQSEADAYQDVFCDGYSFRAAARLRDLSRESIRSYVKRLRARARAWSKTRHVEQNAEALDTNPEACKE